MKALRTFRVHPSLPSQLLPLNELASNLRWAWDRRTIELFRWVDADAWEDVGGNPVALLGRLAPQRAQALVDDAAFLSELADVHADLRRYVEKPRWAQSRRPAPPRVAYFSPEFGITHVMQTYSGGLGVLAGDHLKAASDLGVDLVGVGLLYRHGYFRQHLDADGWQGERYPDLNPLNLPLARLEREGVAATIDVAVGDRVVSCQIWKAQVGRVPLLLLDTDVAANASEDRVITDKLYGGDVEHRLRQEIVLGIGGMRALDLAREIGGLGGEWQEQGPDVFHSNEGHAGFLQLERIRRLMVEEGLTLDQAVECARPAVLFTTHTPVPAGIDVFPGDLMARYFSHFAHECGTTLDELMRLGQEHQEGSSGRFNMAVMGLRLSATANGVSQLHGRVSRKMFQGLWPGMPSDEVPITSVTNGVHAATWVGQEMSAVYDRHLAPDWAHNPDAWRRVHDIGDDALWRARSRARERLVQRVRSSVYASRVRRGESPGSLAWTDEIFDPDALTIGFARRFAEYKRGNLLLRQADRLRTLLLATDRPVQFVFAGKAHPRDELGKDIIRQLVHFSGDPEIRTRFVMVEDYDMDLAQVLYQGVDVWLNNPRRPHEACGTSGEKAVLNGALHCSTMDGWWDEMFDGENGYAIGAGEDNPDAAQQDSADAHALFELLEQTLIPTFYERTEGPLPRRWVARVRRSLQTLGPRVLATRMVREYVDDLYAPLNARAQRLNADRHARAKALASWRTQVREAWTDVAVRGVTGDEAVAQVGEERDVRVLVDLGSLAPQDVTVELVHGAVRSDGYIDTRSIQPLEHLGEEGRCQLFAGRFRAGASGEYGFAVRVVPADDDLLSWADTGLVCWAEDGLATVAEAVGAGA
ncbi:MAG: alpha-glucan family phosphorylase [Nitriliruptorales bacterium]|nr:alpha-glucan family phosphorylase [Nitriliruptorales bacterium]